MNAPSEAERQAAELRALRADDLQAVLAIEQSAYSHPWTLGHFRDALASGYWAQGLWLQDHLLGHVVAMPGVQEAHLLNIAVAPRRQGQGWAHMMLDALALWSRRQGAECLWLEVRESNQRALQVYARYGFRRVGLRKDYYPADRQQREHAVVMSLNLTPNPAP
ncbi:MAG: ribosomal-protein-alanine N-acetyltransferase [Betaproteobacteria bacterium]|nr:ribosomal-protein-alanine N-acetyltransferase [Betaproteobacteria bacterium]